MPDDGGDNFIVAYGAGYYLWLASLIGGAIAAFMTISIKSETI